jgi:DNA primase
MTVEEIKNSYSMRDIVARYGLEPNHAGFLHCPFHKGDRQGSLKIYDKDFHCFGCGANGDIIDFVMRMENISFKEAFQSLGGTYEKPTFSDRLSIYRSEKRRQQLQKEAKKKQDELHAVNGKIDEYRAKMEQSEPLSEQWCTSYNALQYQLYLHGLMTGIEF